MKRLKLRIPGNLVGIALAGILAAELSLPRLLYTPLDPGVALQTDDLLEKAEQNIFRILEQQESVEKFAIGDILLGNHDRIVFGAMNLGNIMVSMQEEGGELWAIDTAAMLPTAAPVNKIIASGSLGGGGFHTAKTATAKPQELIGSFYETVILVMKQADPGDPARGTPPWQIYQQAYEAQKASENGDAYVRLRLVEAEKERWTKWDGRFPSSVMQMGNGSAGGSLSPVLFLPPLSVFDVPKTTRVEEKK